MKMLLLWVALLRSPSFPAGYQLPPCVFQCISCCTQEWVLLFKKKKKKYQITRPCIHFDVQQLKCMKKNWSIPSSYIFIICLSLCVRARTTLAESAQCAELKSEWELLLSERVPENLPINFCLADLATKEAFFHRTFSSSAESMQC